MPRIIKGTQKPKERKPEAPLNAQLQRIHELEREISESRTHMNNVAALLTLCAETTDNFRVSVAATTALRRVLVKLARQGDLPITAAAKSKASSVVAAASKSGADGAADAAQHQVQTWLHQKYRAFLNQLFGMLRHTDERLQISALHLLMDFVALECEVRATSAENHDRAAFFTELYWSVLLHALANERQSALLHAELVATYVNSYDDVRFYACKAIKHFAGRPWSELAQELQRTQSASDAARRSDAASGSSISSTSSDSMPVENAAFCQNVVNLLLKIEIPASREIAGDAKYFANASAPDWTSSSSAASGALRRSAAANPADQRRTLAEAWLTVLRLRLPLPVYKSVLLEVPTRVLPCLAAASGVGAEVAAAAAGHEHRSGSAATAVSASSVSPLRLADFLTDSYRMGGVISLLSLNGLFLLMQDYNLDYPEFYPRLYALLQPHVFHAKYRQRFFRLLDLFLSSSYVPAYMLAAFAKRLCRLALSAPPSGCLFIMALTFNLIRRHPTLLPLIHRTPGGKAAASGAVAAAAISNASVAASSTGASKRKSASDTVSAVKKSKMRDCDDEDVEESDDSSGEESDASASSEDEDNDDDDDDDDDEQVDEFEAMRQRAAAAAAAVLNADPNAGIDVFDAEQDDPTLARALESSLWEIKSLQNHYMWAVASQAKVFEAENAPKADVDVEPLAVQSYHSMMEEEIARKADAKPALAVHKPTSLFGVAGAAASTNGSGLLGPVFSAWCM